MHVSVWAMASSGGEPFGFEGFTLDLTRGCLLGEAGEIELRPKSFELLRYLIENAGRLIPKDELVTAVWPNVIVSDDSLAQCVSDLRSALNDSERRIIKTVPRRGYLFAAEVSSERVQRTTRRLAAILAVDVAGYHSRLIEADLGGTLRALEAIRADLLDPTIAAHNGRLLKKSGDLLLVEFSNVVDALRCATRLQGAMAEHNRALPAEKRVEFRIGIHQGDVVIEGGHIFGDGVNVAARLEALAEPGVSVLAGSCATRCATSSTCRSTISASGRSRTSLDPCAPIVSLSAHRPARRRRSQRRRRTDLRCHFLTSHRSQSCRFKT
jgi:DNA-binding winged helix-turn-helix (wHTH) protein